MLIFQALSPQDKEDTYCNRRADFPEGRGGAGFGPEGVVRTTPRAQNQPQQRDSGKWAAGRLNLAQYAG